MPRSPSSAGAACLLLVDLARVIPDRDGRRLDPADDSGRRDQVVVVGRGSTDDAQSRRLSGYNGRRLSEASTRPCAGTSTARRPRPARSAVLLACDLLGRLMRAVVSWRTSSTTSSPAPPTRSPPSGAGCCSPPTTPPTPALTRRWTLGFGDTRREPRQGRRLRHPGPVRSCRAGGRHGRQVRGQHPPDRLSEAETIAALESALDVDPQAAAELGRQPADAAPAGPRRGPRVRLVLEVLGQLRPEVLLRFQRDRGERAFAMSDAVLAQLSMVFGSTDEVAAAQLRRVADHITQGLLSDPARLLDAYELLGHLSPRDRASNRVARPAGPRAHSAARRADLDRDCRARPASPPRPPCSSTRSSRHGTA